MKTPRWKGRASPQHMHMIVWTCKGSTPAYPYTSTYASRSYVLIDGAMLNAYGKQLFCPLYGCRSSKDHKMCLSTLQTTPHILRMN